MAWSCFPAKRTCWPPRFANQPAKSAVTRGRISFKTNALACQIHVSVKSFDPAEASALFLKLRAITEGSNMNQSVFLFSLLFAAGLGRMSAQVPSAPGESLESRLRSLNVKIVSSPIKRPSGIIPPKIDPVTSQVLQQQSDEAHLEKEQLMAAHGAGTPTGAATPVTSTPASPTRTAPQVGRTTAAPITSQSGPTTGKVGFTGGVRTNSAPGTVGTVTPGLKAPTLNTSALTCPFSAKTGAPIIDSVSGKKSDIFFTPEVGPGPTHITNTPSKAAISARHKAREVFISRAGFRIMPHP